MVAHWLLLSGPRSPGCVEPVVAAAERGFFDGAALLELHELWTGTASAGADVSSDRDLAMKISQDEMGLTRVGRRLRVLQRLRTAVGMQSSTSQLFTCRHEHSIWNAMRTIHWVDVTISFSCIILYFIAHSISRGGCFLLHF